ncbi:MAG: hypothetical protein ACLP9L_17830 [Thermoguttaceae bacterium]
MKTCLAMLLATLCLSSVCWSDEKTTRGANEKSPSRAEYFSWINNAWEGSSEAQTLANLDFFAWLRSEYGMQLDIYAFDAGNIDSQGYYGSMDSDRFHGKFPGGFDKIGAIAGQLGIQLGIWGGPDGFGNNPEEQRKRTEMIVKLCRDDHFGLLKLDACASGLRPEKRDAFVEMIRTCRKYCPELIVLNHRIDLGRAEPWVTTFLFEGAETYIDVHMGNDMGRAKTATHNRAGALSRRLVPGLKRLTEDHGVCLSSCLDYWEDDLVLQAFNRCLILAPEIYGNPWFLADDEFPRLARIYNLHRRFRDILVNGMTLPEADYGPYAVSRGNGDTRFVTLRNLTWKPVKYKVRLDEAIGLSGGGKVQLRRFHPTERILGKYPFGATAELEVLPFRACLVMATTKPATEIGVSGCDYEIVRDVPGKPVTVKLLGSAGEKATVAIAPTGAKFNSATLDGRPLTGLIDGRGVEISFPGTPLKQPWHRKLGDLRPVAVPADAQALYEATCYAADNNALEIRSLFRSGPTRVPQVQKARDAFFRAPLFVDYGIWDRNLFDGQMETQFNVHAANPRHGGSLRVDFGGAVRLDRLVLRGPGIKPPRAAEVSADLKIWTPVRLTSEKDSVVAELADNGLVRYFRTAGLPGPLAEVEGYRSGRPADRTKWRASNLFAPYTKVAAKSAWSLSLVLDEAPQGSYLVIPLAGRHGIEGAYAAVRIAGRPVGAPSRATSYPANAWEAPVRQTDSNYTYYVPATKDVVGKPIDVVVLVLADGINDFRPEAWITAYPVPLESHELVLDRR